MRKTKLSIAVRALFQESQEPLSVLDVQARLRRRKMTPNKTTLYRMLDRFCAQGITKKIILREDMAHYEKASSPHAHFVCTACNAIACLPHITPETITPGAAFGTITSAQLALKGVCAACS